MPPGNTCYSWVSDREAIAVVNVYKIEGGKVVQIEQKLTPAQSAAEQLSVPSHSPNSRCSMPPISSGEGRALSTRKSA